MRKIEVIRGWMLMTVLAVFAVLVSKLVVVGGKNPVEAVLVALILGMIIGNLRLTPAFCAAGIKAYEKLLILGIVLLGSAVTLGALKGAAKALVVIAVTMTASFWLIVLAARLLKLPENLPAKGGSRSRTAPPEAPPGTAPRQEGRAAIPQEAGEEPGEDLALLQCQDFLDPIDRVLRVLVRRLDLRFGLGAERLEELVELLRRPVERDHLLLELGPAKPERVALLEKPRENPVDLLHLLRRQLHAVDEDEKRETGRFAHVVLRPEQALRARRNRRDQSQQDRHRCDPESFSSHVRFLLFVTRPPVRYEAAVNGAVQTCGGSVKSPTGWTGWRGCGKLAPRSRR